jgi:hypothetical protein
MIALRQKLTQAIELEQKMSNPLVNVFQAVDAILRPMASKLTIVHDTADHFYLDTNVKDAKGKAIFFAAARISKDRVLAYLMPVYTDPDLLDGISDALKKRMQGKSCFNFKTLDQALLKEFAALAKAGFKRYQADGRA